MHANAAMRKKLLFVPLLMVYKAAMCVESPVEEKPLELTPNIISGKENLYCKVFPLLVL